MSQLVPNRLLFRFEFRLRYRRSLPQIDGRLRDWTDRELLPHLGSIDQERSMGRVWSCWNEEGLAIAARVTGRRSALRCDPRNFWKGDNLRLMIDTRDARTNKRASQYCHQFYFLAQGGPKNSAIGASAPIHRAKENSPGVDPERISIASRIGKEDYSLEAIVPADCLHGFDPSQHPRLGFYYILEDMEWGRQSFSIGDDLSWHVDPSLWATAVLEDSTED